MQTFLDAIQSCYTTGLDLSHYSLIDGFLDLPGDMRECGIMQDTRIVCVSPQATDSVISALAALTASVEKKEKAEGEESGVYTYMAFKSLDDETGARIFGRWRNREAMEGGNRGVLDEQQEIHEEHGMQGISPKWKRVATSIVSR